MKTITLTDKQFDAIFDFIDSKLEFVLEYEMDNPDILEEWEDYLMLMRHYIMSKKSMKINLQRHRQNNQRQSGNYDV